MRVDILSREYPPEVYGGAGVHVAELVNALRPTTDVVVRAFGKPRDESEVFSYLVPAQLTSANPALATLGVDLQMAEDVAGADLVHSHTWYANGAGHLAKLLHGIPHVVTAHSLEPLRPWKAEQLGGGYRVSTWIEKTAFEAADAVIAVSAGMASDILRSYPAIDPERVRVVHNGIDLDRWQRVDEPDVVRSLGIDPDRPSVVFVGRITRQKGLPYLLAAAKRLPADVQLVLCAGAPDTPEILAEVRAGGEALQSPRPRRVQLGQHRRANPGDLRGTARVVWNHHVRRARTLRSDRRSGREQHPRLRDLECSARRAVGRPRAEWRRQDDAVADRLGDHPPELGQRDHPR